MSSEVEAFGMIAAAAMLPLAAALGAGWAAWQGGKLLVDTFQSVEREVQEKKLRLDEEKRHRSMAAQAAHKRLVEMCSQILAEIPQNPTSEEERKLQIELQAIIHEPVTDDTARTESMVAAGYARLESILKRKSRLAEITLQDPAANSITVADAMKQIRVALAALQITERTGQDVRAADPEVLERTELNRQLSELTDKVMAALSYTDMLTTKFGLNKSNSTWLHSCFNGIDTLIAELYNPSTSNASLRKGIRRLEEALGQYNKMLPTIVKEQEKMFALYRVYCDMSKGLGETIAAMSSFATVEALEARMNELQKRTERAQKCAQIYQKLGPDAYLCFALDQELTALGYTVHSKQKVAEMAGAEPTRATVDGKELPVYRWNGTDITALYAMADQCSLQVIVHEDGTVSMQTIAEADDDAATRKTQQSHCSQLQKLHENMKKNWFIVYDYRETESPDTIKTAAEWRSSDAYALKEGKTAPSGLIQEQRDTKDKTQLRKEAK